MKATNVRVQLLAMSASEQIEKSEYYFKTGYGCYSAHDEFIGVRMPDIRRIAKEFHALSRKEVSKLLRSKVHEDRLCALIILVLQMKSTVKVANLSEVEHIAKFYLTHKECVNNWDLVDASAHYILGQYILLFPAKADILYELIRSQSMWDRRIAMVSQWLMIRQGQYKHVLPLASQLLDDKEDLIHKAVGWMLREYWKKEPHVVEGFLHDHYKNIPRTTLRYAIEKCESAKRKAILQGCFQSSREKIAKNW